LFDSVKSGCSSQLFFQFHFLGNDCFEAYLGANDTKKFVRDTDGIHFLPAIAGAATKDTAYENWNETLTTFKQWSITLVSAAETAAKTAA
jgi:hypothetical protein